MSHIVFSPKSISYALVAHNHFKVGYVVLEVITDARKYGIINICKYILISSNNILLYFTTD